MPRTDDPKASENTHSVIFSKPRDLSREFGISPKTLMRWAAAGKINRFKVNSRLVLFKREEIQSYIENAKVSKGGVK
ncbi:putative site-specific integrase-resolvase [Ereboglobus sp. PH5-10]|uniref:helix-turn-helix domain-containing protein n=1 Tax=Ereboglobus sp. PH5-10 TaxID=2940629 RepID=UPI002406C115|nr:helix-turn-helix domain-containing protein [Ereboglobus sp. PH5-10]MDF9828652.1 putative site-specific integrase-resolvase [Ereboglobus sp. PH5-10]